MYIDSLGKHLLSAYSSLGSAWEIKKREMRRCLPAFKGRISQVEPRTVDRPYGTAEEEQSTADYGVKESNKVEVTVKLS